MKPRGSSATMAHRDPAADDTDFFPTPPWGARVGGELIRWMDPAARTAWEPACGAGHMVHGLKDYFDHVAASDAFVYDRNAVFDFVNGAAIDAPVLGVDWIVTNPPFSHLDSFIRRGHGLARRGVAVLVRLAVLEGVERHQLLTRDCPLTLSAPFAERLPMVKGRYDAEASSAAAYTWLLFLKPVAVAASPMRGAIMAARRFDLHLQGGVKPGAKKRLIRPSDAAFAVRDADWREAA